ncbi:adhesion G-protein coupled receptor G4-like isoform X2 [Amphiura filiformis]|uniref:adhesion G-protein coupled receptor G4-like isoform X2 n=1 Tax=Amphiura filiformis TaxID=82378 RepID=UPI003B21C41A
MIQRTKVQKTFMLRLWNNTNLRLLDQSQVTITEGDDDINGNPTANEEQATCPREILSTPYGDVTLRSGDLTKTRNSGLVCPVTTENAGLSVITAVCLLDTEENQAYWDWKINCGQDFGAEQALETLVQDPISEANVMGILGATEELTRREVGVGGVSTTAQILEATVDLASSNREVTRTLVKIVDNLMNLNPQTLFDANQQDAAPTRIVAAMENQLQHVELSVFNAYRQIEENVAVEVIMATTEDFQTGLGVASYDRAGTRHKDRTDLTIMDASFLPSEIPPLAALYLPQEVVDATNVDNPNDVRVTFTVLSINDILPSNMLAEINNEDTGYNRDVNSRVISAIVGGEDKKGLKTPAVITFKPLASRANNTECVFWDFGINDWSTEGCRSLGESIDGLQQCECDHLTNFAVLMDIYGQTALTKTQDYILEILSYVGCCLSTLGLIVTLITYASSKNLRTKNPNKILMNLCGALTGLYLVFIAMISIDTTRGEAEFPSIGCGIVAGLLHYFTLASLCWMAVEGFNMYLLFVRVVNSYVRSLLLKASLIGWGLPALIVITTGAAARTTYARTDFCFLETYPLLGGVLVPIGLIMIFNIVLFVLIMRSLTRRRPASTAQKKRKEARFRRIRNAIMITLLLGLTWAFGFLGLIQAATFLHK